MKNNKKPTKEQLLPSSDDEEKNTIYKKEEKKQKPSKKDDNEYGSLEDDLNDIMNGFDWVIINEKKNKKKEIEINLSLFQNLKELWNIQKVLLDNQILDFESKFLFI